MISRRYFRNRVLDLTLLLVVACCMARNAGAVQITLERTLKSDSAVIDVALSPDGKLLASGTNNGVRLWDAQTGKSKSAWRWSNDYIHALAFSPDGKLLASASDDGLVRIWNISTGRVLHLLRGQQEELSCIAFSPDGLSIAVGSLEPSAKDEASSGQLRIWDVSAGKLKHTLHRSGRSGIGAVVWSPDGKTIAATTLGSKQEPSIHLWDARTWKPRPITASPSEIDAMVFSGDTLITVGPESSSSTIFQFLNARDGHLNKVVRDNTRFARDLVLSPDNKFLAVASDDNGAETTRIHLRDARTGQILQNVKERPKNIFSLAFSEDSLLAAGSQDGTIYLWRVK